MFAVEMAIFWLMAGITAPGQRLLVPWTSLRGSPDAIAHRVLHLGAFTLMNTCSEIASTEAG